jgi:hypothetical protein
VYPFRSDFLLDAGEDKLSVYRFGPKNKQHKFCKICGTSLMIDFAEEPKNSPFGSISDYMAVNVSANPGESWIGADRH